MAELSAKGSVAHDQHQRSAADRLARRWGENIVLAALVGLGYFLAARLSIGLVLKPEGVAVFWPAAGISSGVLIALGSRRARWPVAAGVTLATIAIHQLTADPLWAGAALGLCNAAEALITAELIELYFGANFLFDRVVQVLGLLVAAIIGTVISGIGGAVTYRLFNGPSAGLLTTWEHWFASDAIGIIAVAPLVIGLAAATRQPPPRSELIEGVSALAALAVMTGISISLPEDSWKTVAPVALLFPMLLWLAARCRPVFAAAAAFLVSMSVVATAVFGVGHFGDAGLAMADRVAQAQAAILFVALGAYVLAALFAERRASETRLARANMMLERERDNKLMSAQAITAAIAHEVRQPLAGIVTNASAAARWLGRTPPDHDEVQAALKRIQTESHRTSDVFDAIRALFRSGDQGRQPIDVNAIIREVIESLSGEFKDHAVEAHLDLTELPLVDAHKGQLREVIFNLVHNALEAMDGTTDRIRLLRVMTQRRDADAIKVLIEDSGPGIDPQKLERIFTAFVTTKSQGMGLGLAICRMIIEQHGGTLSATSDGKNGAVFQFVLPIGSITAHTE
ncbi:MAG: MASE1 domain-containing protein [Xanthobacteraceae bacterium]|nr:MASE1 domain-containing protein [Xanthobacteraceae bacterium]